MVTALLLASCTHPAPTRSPQRLLDLSAEGAPAKVADIQIGHDTRHALVASARYQVYLPARALLVFALAAPSRNEEAARGFFRLRVRADGRDVGERQLNPRAVAGFKAMSLGFEGSGRTGTLDLDLTLEKGGEAQPVPPEVTLAVADPLLLDLGALGPRRGVVLISIDTLRRDHVGLYGYPKPTTPRLDALGRQGLVCDDAVSVSSWTLPAHVSMMTSVEPAAHGAIDMKHGFNHRVPTLGTVFRRAGWLTQAITSHLYVSPEYGFDDGFDALDYAYDRKGLDVANHALEFLDGVGDRPFFLFLHFYDPHWHYAPPPELVPIFEPEPYTGTLTGSWWQLRNRTRDQTTPADLAHLLALYDGEIRYTDGQVARVLERLRARALDQTTLVAVTSDHGEEFLEHGHWEHQRTLYEELVRIPLLLAGPGVAPGQRVASQVSLLDLAPTLLDWAGLPPLPTQRGRSLLRPLEEREAYGETDHGLLDTRKLFLRAGAVKWKAILTFDRKTDAAVSEEWYDLANDPQETRSARPPAPAAAAIRARLLERWQEARRRGQGGRPVDLSPEQLEQLRALGYVQ